LSFRCLIGTGQAAYEKPYYRGAGYKLMSIICSLKAVRKKGGLPVFTRADCRAWHGIQVILTEKTLPLLLQWGCRLWNWVN